MPKGEDFIQVPSLVLREGGIGVLSDIDLFSNFKCAEKLSFALCRKDRKKRI